MTEVTQTAPALDLPDADMALLCQAVGRARYLPGSADKRKARAFAAIPTANLTSRQREAAIRLAYRYRRQMPNDVIAMLSQFSIERLKG